MQTKKVNTLFGCAVGTLASYAVLKYTDVPSLGVFVGVVYLIIANYLILDSLFSDNKVTRVGWPHDCVWVHPNYAWWVWAILTALPTSLIILT